MLKFSETRSVTFPVAAIFLAVSSMTANAEPLERTGSAMITVGGEALTYHTVQVKTEARTYRSSTYIENQHTGEYAISVTAYENPQPGEDLDALIPVADGRLITVFAFINAEGLETRNAEITWEFDPEGRDYWASDAMSDDVTLQLGSFDLDPAEGHFQGTFSGRVCHVSLPVVRVDQDNCKDVTVRIDSELTRLY